MHTGNAVKAQNYKVQFFSTKQLHFLILCTFTRFGESGFGESGLNHAAVVAEKAYWHVLP